MAKRNQNWFGEQGQKRQKMHRDSKMGLRREGRTFHKKQGCEFGGIQLTWIKENWRSENSERIRQKQETGTANSS